MSQKTKQKMIRRAMIFGFFSAEFIVAFGCIGLSPFMYAILGIAGTAIPAVAMWGK